MATSSVRHGVRLIGIVLGAPSSMLRTAEMVNRVLRVQDNGLGIPLTSIQNVLRRFYRLEARRTTPGSGLGLTLAAAIAARHG
jgi:signal transduction histidine kinase